jgi:hypothetical protein
MKKKNLFNKRNKSVNIISKRKSSSDSRNILIDLKVLTKISQTIFKESNVNEFMLQMTFIMSQHSGSEKVIFFFSFIFFKFFF